jgi:hypothetical protein
MTRFDDNLWHEVERKYGSELSGADGPLSSGPRRRLPIIAGTTLGVAGASAAAVVVLGAASSPPAFAVTSNPDGTVSVVIHRVDGIPGANRRLAQLGIRVRAVPVNAQCQAAVAPALKQVTIATLKHDRGSGWIGGVAGGVNARIRPAQIARDRTLVIAAVPSKGQVRLVRGRAVRGAIPGCLPPVALLRGTARGVKARILSCSVVPSPSKHPITVFPSGANTTATNETTSTSPATGSATTTGPATAAASPKTQTVVTPTTNQTVTTGATATATSTATATTGSGPSPGWQSQTSGSSASATPVAPPPIMQACLNAARHVAEGRGGVQLSEHASH